MRQLLVAARGKPRCADAPTALLQPILHNTTTLAGPGTLAEVYLVLACASRPRQGCVRRVFRDVGRRRPTALRAAAPTVLTGMPPFIPSCSAHYSLRAYLKHALLRQGAKAA